MKKLFLLTAITIAIVISCKKEKSQQTIAKNNPYSNPARKDCWICWECDVYNNYAIIPSTLDTFCDSARYEYHRKFLYPTPHGCKKN